MGGEPGQILSFRKAAAGDFPTRKACWKHLAHEECLADEQVGPLLFSVLDTKRGNPKLRCLLVAMLS